MTYDERVEIALGLVDHLDDDTLKACRSDGLIVAMALSYAHPEMKRRKYPDSNLRQFPNRCNQKGDDS